MQKNKFLIISFHIFLILHTFFVGLTFFYATRGYAAFAVFCVFILMCLVNYIFVMIGLLGGIKKIKANQHLLNQKLSRIEKQHFLENQKNIMQASRTIQRQLVTKKTLLIYALISSIAAVFAPLPLIFTAKFIFAVWLLYGAVCAAACIIAIISLFKLLKYKKELKILYAVFNLPEAFTGAATLNGSIQKINFDNIEANDISVDGIEIGRKEVVVFNIETETSSEQLFNILCALNSPAAGQIYFNGINAQQISRENYFSKIYAFEPLPLTEPGLVLSNFESQILNNKNERVAERARAVAKEAAPKLAGVISELEIAAAINQSASVYIIKNCLDTLPDGKFKQAFDALRDVFDESIIILFTKNNIKLDKNTRVLRIHNWQLLNVDEIIETSPVKIQAVRKVYEKEKGKGKK